MSKLRYVVLTELAKRLHYVVVHRPDTNWLQIVAKFTAKDRADSYADIENLIIDEDDDDFTVPYDDGTEVAPTLPEPEAGLSRFIVASLQPPVPAEVVRDLPSSSEIVEQEEPETVEPEEPKLCLADRIEAALPVLFKEYSDGPNISDLCKVFNTKGNEIRETVNDFAARNILTIKKRPGSGVLYVVPKTKELLAEVTESKKLAEPSIDKPVPETPHAEKAAKYDHDRVLDMWADGLTGQEIANELGMSSAEAARTIVNRARKAGDPRAMARQTNSSPDPLPKTDTRADSEAPDPQYSGLGKKQAAVYRVLVENQDSGGFVSLSRAEIIKRSGTAKGSLSYLLDCLCKNNKIRELGGRIEVVSAPCTRVEQTPGKLPMADGCDCADGRLEREETIGNHVIRYWICKCPKERQWSTRHDIKELVLCTP